MNMASQDTQLHQNQQFSDDHQNLQVNSLV